MLGITGHGEKTMNEETSADRAPVEAIVTRQLLEWMAGPNTGLSSEAMAYCVLQIERTDHWSGKEHPYDPSDFNRCLLLVEKVPVVRDCFAEIAAMSPEWAALIAAWEELQSMFVAEVGWNWSTGRLAPKTYARMQEILSL